MTVDVVDRQDGASDRPGGETADGRLPIGAAAAGPAGDAAGGHAHRHGPDHHHAGDHGPTGHDRHHHGHAVGHDHGSAPRVGFAGLPPLGLSGPALTGQSASGGETRAIRIAPSLLRFGLGQRLAIAAGTIAALWGATFLVIG